MQTIEYAVILGALLKGANPLYPNLKGANLKGANLTGANLTGANLKSANLMGTKLKGAKLKGANINVKHFRLQTSFKIFSWMQTFKIN